MPRIPTTLEEALRLTAKRIAEGGDYRGEYDIQCAEM